MNKTSKSEHPGHSYNEGKSYICGLKPLLSSVVELRFLQVIENHFTPY